MRHSPASASRHRQCPWCRLGRADSEILRRGSVVCLECGWRGQMLRRHVMTAHELTVDAYRGRWNLTPEHPITAPWILRATADTQSDGRTSLSRPDWVSASDEIGPVIAGKPGQF